MTSGTLPSKTDQVKGTASLVVSAIALTLVVSYRDMLLTRPVAIIDASWNHLLDIVGDDEFNLWFWGTLILSTAVYWLIGAFYIVLDLTTVLSKYKVQPGRNEPVDKHKLAKAIGGVLFNQLVIGAPFQYCIYQCVMQRGVPPVRELPSLLSIPFTLATVALVEEACFYYSHRLLHTRLLYRHIHKRHHEWTAPIAIVAIYCHPVEHIVSNLLPLMLGLTLAGPHLILVWFMISYFTLSTMSHHSGYHLPFLPSPEFHDFHHLKFNECFGLIGILDRFHQTDKEYVSSGLSSRHKILKSFTPIRDLVPIKSTAITK